VVVRTFKIAVEMSDTRRIWRVHATDAETARTVAQDFLSMLDPAVKLGTPEEGLGLFARLKARLTRGSSANRSVTPG